MEGGEERCQATIAKYLTRVAFISLGEFFAESLFALFEGATQP